MKKICFVCWLMTMLSWRVAAQQELSPNAFLLEPYRYNSACSGFETGLHLSLAYTNLWLGVDNAPQEISLAMHQLVTEKNFSVGGVLSCERSGLTKRMECEIAGTYRFLVVDDVWLSLNVGGGVRCLGKDFSLLRQDGDPYFERQSDREVVPRFRMGAWLRLADKSYMAFSVKGVGLGHMNQFGHKQSTHFYWSAEKFFPWRTRYRWVLSGMVYTAIHSPFAFLMAPSLRSDDRWELGISYQTGGNLTPFAKFSLKNHFLLACSYTTCFGRSLGVGASSSFAVMLAVRVEGRD